MKIAELAGVGGKRFRDLNRQLPGRGQYQNLWLGHVRINPAQQWQGKGCGLAGACLGNAQQMVAGQQSRDGLRLDGRRGFIANGGDGFQYCWIQPQFGKRQF